MLCCLDTYELIRVLLLLLHWPKYHRQKANDCRKPVSCLTSTSYCAFVFPSEYSKSEQVKLNNWHTHSFCAFHLALNKILKTLVEKSLKKNEDNMPEREGKKKRSLFQQDKESQHPTKSILPTMWHLITMKTVNAKLHGTSSSGKRTKSSQMFIPPAAYGSSKSGRHFLSSPPPTAPLSSPANSRRRTTISRQSKCFLSSSRINKDEHPKSSQDFFLSVCLSVWLADCLSICPTRTKKRQQEPRACIVSYKT